MQALKYSGFDPLQLPQTSHGTTSRIRQYTAPRHDYHAQPMSNATAVVAPEFAAKLPDTD